MFLCGVAAAALAISACSGGGRNMPQPINGTGGSNGLAPARGSTNIPYGEPLLQGATYLGPAQLGTIGLDVFVTMRDPAGLQRYAADASDPSSASYRQWLTPEQLGDRFGALQSDYDAAVATLKHLGIATKTYPQRQMIRARGPQSNLESALGTVFGLYAKNGQTFVAPATAPHPSANLHASGLAGIVGYTARSRNFVPVRIGNGFTPGLTPQQLANVFDYTGAYAAGYKGAGIKIGIIGTGPITDGDARIAGGNGGDALAFRVLYGVTGAGSVQQVFGTDANVSPGDSPAPGCNNCQFSTGLTTPPPVTAPCSGALPGCNPEDFEAQIDTEQASGLAPDASVLFYIAYNPNECFQTGPCAPGAGSPQEGISLTDDEIQQAIGDNQADIISMSFGESEQDATGYYFDSSGNGFGTNENASLVAEGMAVFVSSGDQGAEECRPNNSNPGAFTSVVNTLCVSSPASDPNVVSVGGTNTPLDSSGRLSSVLTGWTSSGGGCSNVFALPAYQSGVAGLTCSKRAQPDVSLEADTTTGVAVVSNSASGLGGRQVQPFGGTSVAAPEMAAMWALVLQACKATPACNTGPSGHTYRLGNPNPLFYKVLKGTGGLPYANVFYDVQFGANPEPFATPHTAPSATPFPSFAPGFQSGAGYDLVTGVGAPFARNLIKAVVGI
jgi:kumamolisin